MDTTRRGGETGTGVDRRTFVKVAGAGALGAAGLSAAGEKSRTRGGRVRGVGRARNVVFMVSDGCSTGTIGLADEVRRVDPAQTLGGVATGHWARLWGRDGVRRAMQRTASANSLVTDSAAAASAWSIGRKTDNGAISVMPDGSEGEPILVSAKRRGMATGLVSTTRLTHATPAAFVANVPRRSQEEAIARQMLERAVDVMLGGGVDYFAESLLAEHADVNVLRTAAELAGLKPGEVDGRVMGLFTPDHMSYEIDRVRDDDGSEPSLAMMSERALALLEARGDGFVLQIEGGRVDHAAHSNDAAGLVRDQLAFDDAVGAVVAWAAARDDTLVMVTSDHGNANPGLTLYLDDAMEGVRALGRARRSFDWIGGKFWELRNADEMSDDAARAVVREATGVHVEDEAWAMVMRAMLKEGLGDAFRARRSWMHVLGSALGNANGVGFVSGNHTADYTEVTAFGPGSEGFAGLMDNTAVGMAVRAAVGLGR